jgi:hypothetical protein
MSQSHNIYKTGFLFSMFLLTGLIAKPQATGSSQKDSAINAFFGHSESYSYTPADDEFTIELSRVKNEVIISITFRDSLVFDNVSIEREPSFSQNFSLCGYIDYADVKKKGRHIIKKDAYPYPASNDVLYRIKMASTDGAIRTYPPVLLPAVIK